ncbi:hypothetical protein C8J55DRAFT_498974 [Lentinula edodes]|uniref:Uncharacterized protein n=1 Tax=Lentinula lateritia TaxID=40482 RepID=A0A9W9AYG5_9AGAR|nr:hypothetical protein C8J55DRAFT_498974 [Lentinula edodes]
METVGISKGVESTTGIILALGLRCGWRKFALMFRQLMVRPSSPFCNLSSFRVTGFSKLDMDIFTRWLDMRQEAVEAKLNLGSTFKPKPQHHTRREGPMET